MENTNYVFFFVMSELIHHTEILKNIYFWKTLKSEQTSLLKYILVITCNFFDKLWYFTF